MTPHDELALAATLDHLRPFEPIFHTHAFGLTHGDRQRRMAASYWEIGASGARYDRDFILALDQSHFVDAGTLDWRAFDFAIQSLGTDTYLLTYSLQQGPRHTRRSTIWQLTADGWQILYHQGTLVAQAS